MELWQIILVVIFLLFVLDSENFLTAVIVIIVLYWLSGPHTAKDAESPAPAKIEQKQFE